MLKILWIIKMEWQTFKTENAHMECQDQVFYTFSYEKKKSNKCFKVEQKYFSSLNAVWFSPSLKY